MAKGYRACGGCERLIRIDWTQCPYCRMNLGDSGTSPPSEPTPRDLLSFGPIVAKPLTATIWLLVAGWLVLPMIMAPLSVRDTLPHKTWWALWGVIAICAIPVFVAARRLHRRQATWTSRILVSAVLILPPVLAVHLLILALGCANFSGVASSPSGSADCGFRETAMGWIGLFVGSMLLCGSALWVSATDDPPPNPLVR